MRPNRPPVFDQGRNSLPEPVQTGTRFPSWSLRGYFARNYQSLPVAPAITISATISAEFFRTFLDGRCQSREIARIHTPCCTISKGCRRVSSNDTPGQSLGIQLEVSSGNGPAVLGPAGTRGHSTNARP